MKILHTSDWHIGRTFHGHDLASFHAQFFDWLEATVREQQVDAVLVAGDIYDRALPSAESVALLDSVLQRLCEVTTVILTSGNHDSARRLGFGAALMNPRLRLLTRPEAVATPVTLGAGAGAVHVYGLPYLEPDVARPIFASDGFEDVEYGRSHESILGAAMRRVRADLAQRGGGRSIVMAHAFVIGGATSESERDIRVGGVDVVAAEVFTGVDYVALGHLHGPQQVKAAPGDTTALRYSGSPLGFSFSEQDHRKSVSIFELGADGLGEVRQLEVPLARAMVELTGHLDDVLRAITPLVREAWVKVTLTDPKRPAEAHQKLKAELPHLVQLVFAPEGFDAAASDTERVTTRESDPCEVTENFVEYVTGHEADEAERALIEKVNESVRINEVHNA